MKGLLTWLSKRRYTYAPLIEIQISRSRLIHNLNLFRKLAPAGHVAPVLKSNAYGHGLLEVAKILEHERNNDRTIHDSVPFFVVDSYFEAVALRAKGIHTPLLIIGFTRPEIIRETRLRHVSFTVTSLEALKALRNDIFHEVSIHLKLDTGMHRQGLLPTELSEALDILSDSPHLVLEGVCSHLADSDALDSDFTEKQISLWNRLVHQVKNEFPTIRYTHLSATYGHRFTQSIDANLSRLGIGLYGIIEGSGLIPADIHEFKPVLKMTTIISGVKKLAAHESIGYGHTFTTERDITVATIPVGYYEGLDRGLSNKGFVLVGQDEIPCPIVGRVSMNIASIDVSAVPHATIGMPIVVISDDQNDPNSIASMAKLAGTIGYELTVKIPSQLKRVVV